MDSIQLLKYNLNRLKLTKTNHRINQMQFLNWLKHHFTLKNKIVLEIWRILIC